MTWALDVLNRPKLLTYQYGGQVEGIDLSYGPLTGQVTAVDDGVVQLQTVYDSGVFASQQTTIASMGGPYAVYGEEQGGSAAEPHGRARARSTGLPPSR